MRKKPELSEENIGKFERALYREERERSTVEVYLRNLRRFAAWAEGGAADKETALRWKETLLEQGYSPVTINAMLAAVNKFFVLMGVVCSKRLLNHMIWKSLRTHNFTYRRKETKL